MRLVPVLALAALALAVTAVAPAAVPAPKRALVTWRVGDETFRTYLRRTSDIARVRQAIRERVSAGIPIGRITRGTRENKGHPWHLVNVTLADVTRLDAVGSFCPWSAIPVRLRWVRA